MAFGKCAFCASASFLMLVSASVQAEALSECYKNAENRVQVRQCLQKELDQTQREYEEILEKLSAQLSDREGQPYGAGQKKHKRAGGLTSMLSSANSAFELYAKKECGFESAMMGSGTGAGNQMIACRINLLHTRIGALSSFLRFSPGSSVNNQ